MPPDTRGAITGFAGMIGTVTVNQFNEYVAALIGLCSLIVLAPRVYASVLRLRKLGKEIAERERDDV